MTYERTMNMKFAKMQGCGNDYVYMDCTKKKLENASLVAQFVSERHFGIGSDGLILINSSDKADFEMEMYNADGSRGEMCGNGIRCVAKYVYDKGLTDKTEITVDTLAGVKRLQLFLKDGKVDTVRVNMGTPIIDCRRIPVTYPENEMIGKPMEVNGRIFNATCVSMGNPHCVLFLDEDVTDMDLTEIGPAFENHPTFPKKINTEFCNIIDDKNIRMRVWERGSGETLACGTGACATQVAAVLNGLTQDEVTIHLLGGDLQIEYDRQNNTVYMTGPARFSFEGDIEIPDLEEKEDVKIYRI